MQGRRRACAALLSLCLALPVTAAYAGSADLSPSGQVDATSTEPTAGGSAAEEAEVPAPSDGVAAAQAAVRPHIAPQPGPVLLPVSRGLPAAPAALATSIQDELSSEWLGDPDHVAVTVRDVATGEHLVDQNSDAALTPASTTKLLAAAAIVTSLPMDEPFRTTVVTGEEAHEIILVAGGDTMIARGAGDPTQVEGRAGLADLADQTVAELKTRGMGTTDTPVRVSLDMSYAHGPDRAPGWTDYWLAEGYTGRITMLALLEDRAIPYHPAPADPAQVTALTFKDALRERGVELTGGPKTTANEVVAPAGTELLAQVESAPARDVLSEALASSDNAMVEQLARQAAVADGAGADPASVTTWVLEQVAGYGVDVTGVELADVSGLSDGTSIPARVLADLLVVGADGDDPELQSVLGELPIAGFSGTLWDRFHLDRQAPAVGVARAKTGALPGVTTLAGLVVTQDGRMLAFAVLADDVGRDGAGLEARSVVDSIVAEIASCGC